MLVCALKVLGRSSRKEIGKCNGQKFELWKIKMEDLLVDREHLITVELGTRPTGSTKEYWDKLERRVRSTIEL